MKHDNRIEKTIRTFASLVPLSFYPYLIKRPVVDVFYHVVSDDVLPHVHHLYPVVSTKMFQDALDYLGKNYTFVDYAQLEDHYLKGKPLPPRALHLSFDDGYQECFSVVRPILLEKGIPCTFFVTTGLLDNEILFYRNKVSLCIQKLLDVESDVLEGTITHLHSLGGSALETKQDVINWLKSLRLPDEAIIDEVCRLLGVDADGFLKEKQPYLTTSQLIQMHHEGFTIGAHTKTHRKLGDLPEAEIREEIVGSCKEIKEITHQETVPLSFPNSGARLDRKLLVSIREEYRFVGLFFDTKGFREDIPVILNRVWAERPIIQRGLIEPLPLVLKHAYVEQATEKLIGVLRAIKNR